MDFGLSKGKLLTFKLRKTAAHFVKSGPARVKKGVLSRFYPVWGPVRTGWQKDGSID